MRAQTLITQTLTALSAVAALVACKPAAVEAKADTTPRPAVVETLASYPHGAFLENLTVATDGAVYFTSYFAKALLLMAPGAQAAEFATLPAHPVGILQTADGFIVTAHGTPFTQAPAFLSSNEILFLDAEGKLTKTIRVPEAKFLNGLVQVKPDLILIADSVAGVIWALTPSTGTIRTWLSDPTLTADPASTEQRPAANGLKLHDGVLYISNSSRGAVYRQALTAEGEPQGTPAVFVQPGPVDDFAFAPDGAIYAATHGPALLKILSDGTVSKVIETGCDGCTSVGIRGSADAPELIVLTTGNLVEGGDAPARVLQIRPGA